MAQNTQNFNLRKDSQDDYYNVDVFNDNFDKIDSALKIIKDEAKNKDGGNADTVDGKHAADFMNFKVFNSENELRESEYEGYFQINSSYQCGISFRVPNNFDDAPADRKLWHNYIRITSSVDYFYESNVLIVWIDTFSEENTWLHKSKKVEFEEHTHTTSDIIGFPKSLPANGGNADTVDGKHASDLQNYNNLTNKPTSLKNPYSLTIQGNGTTLTNGTYDGSSSKTINIVPSSIGAAASSHTHTKSQITDFPVSLKNPYSLTIKGNGTTLTNGTYDGSSSKTVNITPSSIGAAASNHNHTRLYFGYGEGAYDYSLVIDGENGIVLSTGDADNPEDGETFKASVNYDGFKGSGSGLTNVNASLLNGKNAAALQNYNNLTNKPISLKNPYSLTIQGNGTTLTNGTYDGSTSKTVNITPTAIGAAAYESVTSGDFNNMKTPGLYTMRTTSENAPSTGTYHSLIVLKSDSGEYYQQIAIREGTTDVYVRYGSSGTWGEWKKISDVIALTNSVSSTSTTTAATPSSVKIAYDKANSAYTLAEKAVLKATKSFTAAAGSWYRIAKGGGWESSFENNSGKGGLFTIMADMTNNHSSTIMTVTQNGANGSFKIHNHNTFNEFFKTFRLCKGTDGYMYLDAYTQMAGSGTLTATFQGTGWTFPSSISSANSSYGTVIQTTSPSASN